MSTSLPDRTITLPEQHPPTPSPERGSPASPSKRRRVHIPVFSTRGLRAMAIAALLSTGLAASAQSTVPQSTTQQSVARQQPPAQGWVMFDDQVGTALKLQDDQLKRLRDSDMKYNERYTALGTDPWTNKGYASLTQERERSIQEILTPDQYNTWVRTYGTQRTTTPATMPTPQR